MKRLRAVMVGAVLCIGLVAANAHAATGPKHDLTTGTGKGGLPVHNAGTFPAHVHINAKGDALAAEGSFFAQLTGQAGQDVTLKGSVLCINAVGNESWIRGVVEESNSTVAPAGSHIIGRIIDNGSGSNSPPDEFGARIEGPGSGCPTDPIVTGPIDQGNYVVKDGA